MKHIRIRYSIDKHEPAGHPDLIYAVADHQTGRIVARGLTWDSAHRLIDRLTGVDTSEPEEYSKPSPGARTRAMARCGAFG